VPALLSRLPRYGWRRDARLLVHCAAHYQEFEQICREFAKAA
jgi:hypothetical protein